MSSFHVLFHLRSVHEHLDGAQIPGLQWQADALTAHVLMQAGCRQVPTQEGLTVACDRDRLDTLAAWHEDIAAHGGWRWLAGGPKVSTDIALATAGWQLADCGSLLHFDAHLAPGPMASGDIDILVPTATPAAWPGDGRAVQRALHAPLFQLTLPVDAAHVAGPTRVFHCHLGTTRQHWRYIFVGAWCEPDETLSVIDIDEQLTFTDARPITLPDGRSACAIVSRQAIASRRRPPQRLQLRCRRRGVDRVLVRRLPVARIDHANVLEEDGRRLPVLEIHVHP